MKTSFLISFSGIDGAGKTTLSKALVKELRERGIKCNYVYGRLEPFILKPFILISRKVFLKKERFNKNYEEYSKTKREVLRKHPFLSKVYQSILSIDYLLQLLFKIRIPLIFGKNLICDRYIYDTAVTDMAVDFGFTKPQILSFVRRFFYIAPKPHLAFLIDLPEDIALKRKSDILSEGYLRDRRGIYLEIAREVEMMVLDGSKDFHELQYEVVKIVENFIKEGCTNVRRI
jgi:dTMP kinase